MNGLMYRKMVSCHFPAFIVLLGFFFLRIFRKKSNISQEFAGNSVDDSQDERFFFITSLC